ncbi:hypothetical protein ABBQ32_004404 [Trebouxia sp. C0010 RCD-2024]
MATNANPSMLMGVADSSPQGAHLLTEPVLGAVAGKKAGAVQQGDSPPSLEAEVSYGADDMTCAICLEQIQLENTAYVKGCEHAYCAKCILQWAELREDCSCPQCKKPFSRLLTYRTLDGTMSDFPVEESICLLKRATWVQDQMKTAEKGKAVASSDLFYAVDASEPVTDWQDYSNYYDEYDDDEEVEDFYFSSAAGRARIVLGNRRWGENGYVASGRQQGRPVQRTPPTKAGQGSSGKKPAPGKQAAVKKEAGTADNKGSPGSGLQPASAGIAASDVKPPQQKTALEAVSKSPTGQQAVSIVVDIASDMVSTPVAASGRAAPIAIASSRSQPSTGRCSSGSDVAGTSADGAWGSVNSGSGWASYRQGKKKAALGADPGALGRSPGSEAGPGSSKAGRRARRNAKKAAADAKADVYAY